MRKAQKKKAEDFIELLGQAHEEIRKAVESKKDGIAMDLLGQCQEGVIELGKLIEGAEGEGFMTIPYLEDYCKLTYWIYREIEDGGSGVDADKPMNGFRCHSSPLGPV